MCGIAGLVRFERHSPDSTVVARLVESLAHRGPDADGLIARGPAILGHRRLSIIDLEGGQQPMSNEDGTVWVTFNGEIYNYRELRATLLAEGHAFKTQSDTEVLVHAYEEWGDACVERLRGMFAFAVLDERRRRLFVARDHFGIKPLFYLKTDRFLAFASELQALRLLPDVDWTLDLEALDEYLRLQYIPAPRTIYKSVRKLPPASRFSVTFDGRLSAPDEYWQLRFEPDCGRSEDDTAAELDDVLRESVAAHLVADVPFGAFLSGGVDSSSIVAYMSEILGQPIETFSIGFEEAEFNERPYARQVAAKWSARHHEEVVNPDTLNILPKLVRHYGEPFGDSSAVPTYYLSRLARSRVAMVLSGDGADECFAGYEDSYIPWMRDAPLSDRAVGTPTVRDWLRVVQTTPDEWRQRLWLPDWTVWSDVTPSFEREYRNVLGLSRCLQAQYLDIKTYLPYAILTKVDIASMMNGLEVRTPFVDKRVVEFAATIPESFNIRADAGQAWIGKRMLKRNATKWYDPAFLGRSKQGFGLPVSSWLGDNGKASPEVIGRLQDPHSRLRDYFRPDGIDQVIKYNVTGTMWLLLVLDEWLRYEARAEPR